MLKVGAAGVNKRTTGVTRGNRWRSRIAASPYKKVDAGLPLECDPLGGSHLGCRLSSQKGDRRRRPTEAGAQPKGLRARAAAHSRAKAPERIASDAEQR